MNKKSKEPLVTIIIPVYNGENYLAEAIDSALNQTYKNIEILVVDDGSKDNTAEIAKSYGDKIRYIHKENGGVSTALNTAIDNMKGQYFSWLSHDDVYLPNKIEKQVEFMMSLKNKNSILYSDYGLMDANGKSFAKPVIIEKEITEKEEYCLLRGKINGITLLIPKKVVDKCGYFSEKLRCTQDYDMWAKMMKISPFVYCPGVYTKTRIHPLQDTQKSPKVIEEGNIMWKNFVEYVDDKRKIELEGNLFNYYYEFGLYLNKTPYKDAKEYCINKCKNIDYDLYVSKDIDNIKQDSKIKKLLIYIKNYGLINSFKIIIARIKRKK